MAEQAREIAAIYEPKLDGFISLPHKFIRNPRNPAIVWMQQATWQALAVCATREGEFYIPCQEGLLEPPQLRMLVLQKETS
jgi:hypothetical protein